MMHPHTVLRPVNDTVGVGVFATKPIPCGTLTWVRDPLDLVLEDTIVATMEVHQRGYIHRYAWLQDDAWILCWDHARFVNHSCDANCIGIDVDFEVAIRDIAADEQLTDDYRSLGLFEDPFDCACGSRHCGRVIGPRISDRLIRRWTNGFVAAMARSAAVPQPLAPWLPHGSVHPIGQR